MGASQSSIAINATPTLIFVLWSKTTSISSLMTEFWKLFTLISIMFSSCNTFQKYTYKNTEEIRNYSISIIWLYCLLQKMTNTDLDKSAVGNLRIPNHFGLCCFYQQRLQMQWTQRLKLTVWHNHKAKKIQMHSLNKSAGRAYCSL